MVHRGGVDPERQQRRDFAMFSNAKSGSTKNRQSPKRRPPPKPRRDFQQSGIPAHHSTNWVAPPKGVQGQIIPAISDGPSFNSSKSLRYVESQPSDSNRLKAITKALFSRRNPTLSVWYAIIKTNWDIKWLLRAGPSWRPIGSQADEFIGFRGESSPSGGVLLEKRGNSGRLRRHLPVWLAEFYTGEARGIRGNRCLEESCWELFWESGG